MLTWYMGYFYTWNNNVEVLTINYEQMLCSLCITVLFYFLEDVTENLHVAGSVLKCPLRDNQWEIPEGVWINIAFESIFESWCPRGNS